MNFPRTVVIESDNKKKLVDVLSKEHLVAYCQKVLMVTHLPVFVYFLEHPRKYTIKINLEDPKVNLKKVNEDAKGNVGIGIICSK